MACDLRAIIQKWMNETNPDGTRKWTDAEIAGKIQAARKAGYISQADILVASGRDVRMTPADNARLDELINKVRVSGTTPSSALNGEELKELATLVNKARLNMRDTSGTSSVNVAQVDRALQLLNKDSITNVQDIMEVLDKAIEKAENRGDTDRVQTLHNLKNHLKQASDTSTRIRMDWKTLTQQNEEREKLLIDYGILRSIKAIGTTESREKRDAIEPKLIDLREKLKKKQEEVLENKSKLEEAKKDPTKKKEIKDAKKAYEKSAKEMSEMFKEFQNLNKQLAEVGGKKLDKANEEIDKRLRELERKLSKMDNNMAGSYFAKILVSSLGIDPEYYVTSLREIEKNRQEIEANIRVREEALAKFDDDHKFTEAEVKNLIFTDDLFSVRTMQQFLYEEEKNPDGTVRKDSDNRPVLKKKESITKAEVMQMFELWKMYSREKMFNRTFSPQESQRVQNELLKGDRKLASDVELGQHHETARTHEEAITARPGHDYDGGSPESADKAIRDLTNFMGRLNYLASVPKFNGLVDEALLISSLGVDAQSLIHLFDDDVVDNLSLDNTPQEDTEIDFNTRQNHLRTILKNIGFTDSDINQMPEFTEGESWMHRNNKVVSFDLEWDSKSKTIVAASVVTFIDGRKVDSRVIYSSEGNDKGWSQEDANDFLLVLNDYQNNGFKVIGHNTLGIDSDMQRLVSSSGNTKLGLKVSLRSFDTMLLAFRGGQQTNFSRHFGPSLENLANASGFSLTKSMSGADAFGYWKSGNLSEFEKYISADAEAAGQIFLFMLKNKGNQIQVKNNMSNREETVHLHDIVPMWFDTGVPAEGNRKYKGYHHLFDITSFKNIQELQGGGFNRNMQYDIAKVKQTTIRIIVALMQGRDPNNLNTLIDAIAKTQDEAIENIDGLIELSRKDHKAYLPVLRSIRQRLMDSGALRSGYIASVEPGTTGLTYNPARNADEFRSMTVDSVFEMLKDYYNRDISRALNTFANRIGFRDRESGEDLRTYTAELIEFASTKFNDQDIKIEDYGNGNFDFISAKQLGYGFAQVVLGFVDDGMTLAQSPNTPINKLEERREEQKLAGQILDQTKEKAIIEAREFLRPTPKNVSFFAPLSRFEQERAYSDFALRERIKFVTEVEITDKERQAFNEWVKTNPDIEYRNRIKDLKKQLDKAKKDKNDSLVQSLEHYLLKEQEEYSKFLKEREENRLYQGRVQLYHLINPVKNRDVYNRIPTMAEQKEMALAVSLDLPRFIATFVHDSITYLPDEPVNLNNPLFWKNPALSSGGATGRALLDGIHPQLAWALQHPITKDAVIASIKAGVEEAKAKGREYKRTNYFDDKFSGIHHLAALRLLYYPSIELTRNGGLLKTLNDLTSRVKETDLKDYYEETANIFFDEAMPHLIQKAVTDDEKAQLLRIEKVLKSAGARNFFKGAVIPVMYSGGLPGVLEGLYKKREEEKSELAGLTDDDLILIANSLVKSGYVIQGRLIDKVLEMDSDARTKLANALVADTEDLSVDTRKEYLKIVNTDKNLATGSMSISAAQSGIQLRIEYMAKLLTPPTATDPGDKRSYDERVAEKVKQITEVYQERIDKAVALFKNPDGSFKQIKIGGEEERAFHVALAGDEGAFMNQMTLMFINKAQNAGYKIKFGDNVEVEMSAIGKTITIPRNILESNIRNGRMVNKDDVLFHNHVVFFSMGLYSNNSRAGYVENYLTNPHGGYLSKVERIVYKTDKDGVETSEIDWDETVQNSMWSLADNPLYGKSPAEAAKMADDLMIRNYALFAAPDYAPTFLGYNPENESRENFFKQWSERSKQEYLWEQFGYEAEVAALKADYAKQGITVTNEMIEDWQRSNSIPRDKAIRTRVTVNGVITDASETVMTNNDAKGLGAFRPRYADYSFEDRIVHGLYAIHQGSKRMNLGVESLRSMVNKNKQQGIGPKEVLKMDQRRGHVYDVNTLPYVPQYDSPLIDELRGLRLTAQQRINQRRYVLDTFAINNGMNDELNNQEYARIHQTHQIRNKILKFAKLLAKGVADETQVGFLHTNFIREIHKLTKGQRDASNKERNLLDFAESIGIDPTLFQNDDGTNVTYLDMLMVLADLGVNALAPINLGISPTQFISTDPDFKPDFLKDESSGILPLTVQGEDVATLILGVFGNDVVQRVSTEYVKEAIKKGKIDGTKIRFDKNTKFVLLSTVPIDVQEEIIQLVMKDAKLVNGAITNLGLGVSISSFGGEHRLKFIKNQEHQMSGPTKKGARIIRRIGIGTPTINRTATGESATAFYFTYEDIKAMLTAFANDGIISRVEVSTQIGKTLGGPTRVDQLQRQRYSEFWETQRQALAEESETLQALDPNLMMLQTDRLKDELGIDLNLYDAVHYFDQAKLGYTPFGYAATIDIRQAINKGSRYPSLENEVMQLEVLMEDPTLAAKIGILVALHYNSREFNDTEIKNILRDLFMGTKNDEEIENEIIPKFKEIIKIIDKINYSPMKGKNKYFAQALKYFDNNFVHDLTPDVVDQFMTANSIDIADQALAIEAMKQAKEVRQVAPITDVMTAYPDIGTTDIMLHAATPDAFERAFPEGTRINSELRGLIDSGVIDEEMASYYRFLIAKVLKHNPHLGKYLSISAQDLGANPAAAVKEGDRFRIVLNTNFDRRLGKVDQLRIFAHEMGHIARLAFIETNGAKWRNMESLLRSAKGRQAIETMMLAMNNGKKYEGFDSDLNYYTDNPEEFAAQWAGWLLLKNTFGNAQMMKLLQSRSSIAWTATNLAQQAFHQIGKDILSIGTTLDSMDSDIRDGILGMVEDMFGFTSSVERRIYSENPDTKLFMVSDFESSQVDIESKLQEIERLDNLRRRGTATTAELTRLGNLESEVSSGSDTHLTINQYRQLRAERESKSPPKRTRSAADRVSPGNPVKPVDSLKDDEKKEIVQTILNTGRAYSGKLSLSTATIGGLSRTAANKVFGKRSVDFIVKTRKILTTGSNQAVYTYDNKTDIVAILMHLIGESFSLTEHQFRTELGTRSLMENRNYAKQWANRVSIEIGKLRALVAKDQVEDIMKYSYAKAAGHTISPPPSATREQLAQADEVVKTLIANATEMRRFIHGGNADSFELLPVMLNPKILGTKNRQPSRDELAKFKSEKVNMFDAFVAEIEADFINNDYVHSIIMHTSGMLPRISGIYTDQDIPRYTQELERIRTGNPATMKILMEIAIAEMVKDGFTNAAQARLYVERGASPSLPRGIWQYKTAGGTNIDLVKYFHRASAIMYKSAKHKKKIPEFITNLGISLTNAEIDAFRKEVQTELTRGPSNPNPNFLFTEIESLESRPNLPEGLQYPLKNKEDSLGVADTPQIAMPRTSLHALASMQIFMMGANPDYILKNQIVTQSQMLSNPRLARFLSPHTDAMMVDLERSKGFRAASEIAIEDMTGIRGYNIYDIISIVKSVYDSMPIKPIESKAEILRALEVIQQKLEMEQGLSRRGLDKSENLMTDMMVKYGPDIVKMFFGGSLNAASLIMEGTMGAMLSTVYGRGPTATVTFARDLFGSWLGTFPNLVSTIGTYNPRGMAINMMRGMEEMAIAARLSNEDTSSHLYSDIGRWDKVRAFYNRMHSQTYLAVASALGAQAQRIIITHANNGNLDKLKNLFATSTMKNMSDLRRQMRTLGITGVNSHMVFELKRAGIFEGQNLEIFKWLLANSKTKNGVVNMNEALRTIENMSDVDISRLGFTRPDMYRATSVIYKAQDNFRNIIMVNHNAFDADTNIGGLQFLISFYRQYPNLFFSQIAMRQGHKMSKRMFASVVLATTILDLVYNLLLMVALGTLPLAALSPFSDEFIGKKNLGKMMQTIAARNPFFTVLGNLAAGVAIPLGAAMFDEKTKNDRSAVRNAFEDVFAYQQAMPVAAISQMGMELYDMFNMLYQSGGNMNEAQTHEFMTSMMNGPGRMLPGVGALSFRLAASSAMGPKPQAQPVEMTPDQINNIETRTQRKEVIPGVDTSNGAETIRKMKKISQTPIIPPDRLK